MLARLNIFVVIACAALAHAGCDRRNRDMPSDTRTTSAPGLPGATDAMPAPLDEDASRAVTAAPPSEQDASVGVAADAGAPPDEALPSWVPP
ncbi:MAG TPA: hypothetical protein VM580_22785, partial [Labilithrix sp.]|nr:hypothetical protein [Labilithrix sp.]